MRRFPTVDDVIEWLRNEEQPGMAATIEALKRSEAANRAAAEDAVRQFNALRSKVHPIWRPPDHVARGRNSD